MVSLAAPLQLCFLRPYIAYILYLGRLHNQIVGCLGYSCDLEVIVSAVVVQYWDQVGFSEIWNLLQARV